MAAKAKIVEPQPQAFPIPLVGARRNLIIILVAAIALAFAALEAWRHWGASHAHWESYTLKWEQLDLTPAPPWVRRDVKGDIARTSDLPRLALLNPTLTKQIATAFALHPWVESVREVRKSYPAHVSVELAYRRPVGMVEIEHLGKAGLLPIDRNGTLLPPDDFTITDTKILPRIRIADTFPAGTVGSAWGDARVSGAAQVAWLLLDQWNTSPLYSVNALPLEPGTLPELANFEVTTRDNRKLIWGHAPGKETSGEATVEQKLQKLWNALKHSSAEIVDLRVM
jgi:hypothetical protein